MRAISFTLRTAFLHTTLNTTLSLQSHNNISNKQPSNTNTFCLDQLLLAKTIICFVVTTGTC